MVRGGSGNCPAFAGRFAGMELCASTPPTRTATSYCRRSCAATRQRRRRRRTLRSAVLRRRRRGGALGSRSSTRSARGCPRRSSPIRPYIVAHTGHSLDTHWTLTGHLLDTYWTLTGHSSPSGHTLSRSDDDCFREKITSCHWFIFLIHHNFRLFRNNNGGKRVMI